MRFFVCLLVVACADPAPTPAGEYTLRALVVAPGVLEAGVVSSCTGIRERVFADAVEQTLSLPASGSAVPLELPAGTYRLAARTLDAMCRVTGFACIEVELEEGGSDDFTLELESVDARSTCTPSESCNEGRCVRTGTDAGGPARDAQVRTDVPTCGPGEHLDCFGGRFCRDGVVYQNSNNPQPCNALECPYGELGTCTDGCAAGAYDFRALPWTLFCAGTHLRGEGDACATDADCRPTAPVDGPRVYLTCSAETLTCTPSEPASPPVGGACDPTVLEHEATRHFRVGLADDPSCEGGYCLMTNSAPATCLRGICTIQCASDWDCPSNMRCGNTHDVSIQGGDEAFAGEGPFVCRTSNHYDAFEACSE